MNDDIDPIRNQKKDWQGLEWHGLEWEVPTRTGSQMKGLGRYEVEKTIRRDWNGRLKYEVSNKTEYLNDLRNWTEIL